MCYKSPTIYKKTLQEIKIEIEKRKKAKKLIKKLSKKG